jgi:hypothetical protein
MSGHGSVYKRCGCIDPVTGRQLGTGCPELSGLRHGRWYLRLELPGRDGRRRRIRRGGHRRGRPRRRCWRCCAPPDRGERGDRILTVGDWLVRWLASRTSPAASTMRGYAGHVRLYLAPCLGQVVLAEVSAAHVQSMFTAIVRQHQALGTPVTAATLSRIRATLRAALNAAVRRGLIAELVKSSV